jgi:hypothetical protein
MGGEPANTDISKGRERDMQALTKMRNAENLCAELRNPHERDFATFDRAAEEIERLAKENVRLRKIIEDYDNPLVKYAAAN